MYEEVIAVDSSSCSNGICAIACAAACLITGESAVAFGALGGIAGAWLAGG